MHFAAPEDRDLLKLFKVTDIVLSKRDEMPVTIFKTFLGVALWGHKNVKDEPLTITQLADRVGLPFQTVSRHLRYLGEFERPGKPGMGLVVQEEYPLNRRMKTTSLTAKGRALAQRLKMEITDGNPTEGGEVGN